MRGLFWRVFVWYLATTVVVLAIGIGITRWTDPDFRFVRGVSIAPGAVESQAADAVRAWTDG